MITHPTVKISDNKGYVVPIDEEIVDLITILWDQQYQTTNSCQDNYVMF